MLSRIYPCTTGHILPHKYSLSFKVTDIPLTEKQRLEDDH